MTATLTALLLMLVATAPAGLASHIDSHVRDCRDGQDNDGDGLVDMDDTGCTSRRDRSELGTIACDDGQDNDQDGTTDRFDPGCESGTDTSEWGAVHCDDGLDNDADGETDQSDLGCASLLDATETKEYADFRALPASVASLEIQARSTQPTVADSDAPSGFAGTRVVAAGDRAYVATRTGPDAIVVFDISDPWNPVHLGSVSLGPTTQARAYEALAILDYEDRVVAGVAVVPGSAAPNNVLNLAYMSSGPVDFWDVTNPAAPFLLAQFDGIVHDLAIHEVAKVAYMFPAMQGPGGRHVEVVDLSDPDNIHIATSTLVPGVALDGSFGPEDPRSACHSVKVDAANARLFCSGGGRTLVFDVSDPFHPVLTTTLSHVGSEAILTFDHSYVVPILGDDRYVALTTGAGDCEHTPPPGAKWPWGRVWIFDMHASPPAATGSVGLTLPAGPDCSRFGPGKGAELGQGTGLIAMPWGDGGLVLVDARNPTDPRILDRELTGGQVRDTVYHRGIVFSASSQEILQVAAPVEGDAVPMPPECPSGTLLWIVCR